ncbi:disease resistance protein RPP13-like [Mangifera indica]|uniref:disease resistance protein RPP13-like n=1 Tax=Mangifera indica TaxID=29780 RepID=UPI001CFBA38A|nr:disease resistance protein RPP13-like [Mangifera indica]XP_044469568.1 disease resistance protein RPP13-like [Mangifera indica]
MVDAVVSLVVERVGDYLIKEAAFLQGVRGEVESLKKDLEWMLCFIKDAEEKQVDNPLIRQWVSDIREIAYGCEDVLDNFTVKVHDRKFSNVLKVEEGKTFKRRQGLFTSIKKCSCKFASHVESNLYIEGKENASLYGIGKEIKALKKRLKEVSDRCGMYGLEDINKRWEASKPLREFKEVRRTTSFAFEENVIGYKDDFRMLLGELLCNEQQRSIISIWGTGGLGKTTLAKKLYHHDEVKDKFKHRAWVCVSQDFNVEDLLRRIINSFNVNHTKKLKKMEVEALERNLNESLELEKLKEEALKRYIHEFLRESSYLVVFDDVWGKNAWGRLIEAFPSNEHGSIVIITTRNKNVADCADYVHNLPFLTEEESWRLFYSKTNGKANETKEMEKLGKEMLQKCGGLPLAIVLLGGLLSKKSAQEWRLVHGHMWQHLNRDSDNHINYLLSLSFSDLPYQMKLCFLYMSQFPEDFEIPVMKLIHLLVAEGFIPRNREIMEDIAYYYVNELFRRSLIQKDKTQRGRILTCRIHDLLRNLAIEKAEELNLFHICEVYEGSNGSSKTRRQAVFFGIVNTLQLRQSNLMRSLLFFNIEHRGAMEDLLRVCCSFRLLRVLNLSNIAVKTIPQEIRKLIHLKYLQLGLSFNRDVPQWILNLVSLQTLNVLGNDSYPRLPAEIFKLQELRHLIGNFIGYFCIDKLKNLQTLKCIPVETWIKTNPERLVNLRELHITGFGREISQFTLDSIAKLKSLRILRVYTSRREIHSLNPLSKCLNLVELTLSGRIEKIPEEMPEIFPHLEFLELYSSGVVDDPMPTLEKLPNLAVLNLGFDCYCGTKLVCSKGGFPRLEILAIRGSHLEELQVAEGAMPELRSFIKSYATINFRIPERLESLPRPSNWEYETSDLEQY